MFLSEFSFINLQHCHEQAGGRRRGEGGVEEAKDAGDAAGIHICRNASRFQEVLCSLAHKMVKSVRRE